MSNGIWLGEKFVLHPPNDNGIRFSKLLNVPQIGGLSWNLLKASYYEYYPHNAEDYEYQWRVPNSSVRHTRGSKYIYVRPNDRYYSPYIQVRVCNSCGCSAWRGRTFNIRQPFGVNSTSQSPFYELIDPQNR